MFLGAGRRRMRLFMSYILIAAVLYLMLLQPRTRPINMNDTKGDESAFSIPGEQRRQCHAKYGRLLQPLYSTLEFYKQNGNMTLAQLDGVNCNLFKVKIIDNKVSFKFTQNLGLFKKILI
jgi:hypothetical protein